MDYTANNWGGGGFGASLRLNNLGDPLTAWTLTFTFPGNQRVTQGWNATWSQPQGSANVTATNMSYNGNIATGASIEIGFNGSFSGTTNNNPTNFAINGVPCTGANAAPTVNLTQPTTGTSYTAGANIPLAATAADTDGSIARVEFYAGTTLLSTDTSSPFSGTWSNVPAGNYVLVARAYDDDGAFTNSTPVDVTVSPNAGPSVVVEQAAVSVPESGSANASIRLSQQPTGNVVVTTARTAGDTDLTVGTGASRTFTTTNWNQPQTVQLNAAEDTDSANGVATFTASATGQASATITATEADNDLSDYAQRFLALYNKIKAPANGYFSSHNPPIPYHSVETLIVEAPDYGHVTTSEAFSYWIWLEAQYGQATQDWTRFNQAWQSMETHIIPTAADQPGNANYNPADPATYAPEMDTPNQYPVPLDANVPNGADPLANELQSTYGTRDIYGMHWLLDVDNRYGYGRRGTPNTSPSYINTFQRGPEESVWETVPHPSWEDFDNGSTNGFLPLFVQDSPYAQQWRYTNAPDADARAVQAAYWALQWATAQGQQGQITATLAKAAKLGDYLRYAMFDKYFKQIGNCTSPQCPAGSGKNSAHYLMSWYYAWGGATNGGWSWRIGSSPSHFGYQNPLAAYALANVPQLRPQSPTAVADWQQSFTRQLEFYRWLQSAEGGIAGGATNSWAGRYAAPPAGLSTFYGMYYDWQPVYHDPPSNRWFGMQAWSMERIAELYNQTGNATAKALLDKWVPWAIANTTVNVAAGTWQIPDNLSWTGQPDTWNPASPGANTGLHVTVATRGNDVGITAALVKTLAHYASESGNTAARTMAKNLLDAMWATPNQDTRGISVTESRGDYNRFDDSVYVPSAFSGDMTNGDLINSSSTFIGLRSWYRQDPAWPQVQSHLNGGAAPTFRYHRFWAQADLAMALAEYGRLFPTG
ncbi:glycoside hydrolase family 48 protein [Actinophytocola sp.]|uniref:glycoside hydrolase family 48 protein n=1 Tax=Actinophytocola sp. TaxID=1872138 RepID=UPI002ED5243A